MTGVLSCCIHQAAVDAFVEEVGDIHYTGGASEVCIHKAADWMPSLTHPPDETTHSSGPVAQCFAQFRGNMLYNH